MQDYQMSTVYEYLYLLDGKKVSVDGSLIRANVIKYMKKIEKLRKHSSNALLLESMLA